MGDTKRIKLGEWAVTPALNLLEHDGRPIKIEPRVMDVLVYLADHPSTVVTTTELISAIWPGRIIGDNAVYECIRKLRRILEDDYRAPRFIETIPKRGYRLIAPVRHLAPTRSATAISRLLPRRWQQLLVAGTGFVAALVSVYAVSTWALLGREDVKAPPTLAVLPFENFSGDASQEYLGESIADELIHALSQSSELRVIAPQTSLLGTERNPIRIREISQSLGASVFLDGSIQRANRRLGVTASLVEAESSLELWSGTFDRFEGDLISVEREIALAVAQRLLGNDADVTRIGEALPPLADISAYEYHLLGRMQMRNASGSWGEWNLQAADQAIAYFRRAIASDPSFARAYAGLADALLRRNVIGRSIDESHRVSQEVGQAAFSAIEQAMALDSQLADVHASRGLANQLVNADSLSALEAYREAISLNPSLATAHYRLGRLISLNVFDENHGFAAYAEEAIDSLKAAIALDPMSAEYHKWLAIALRKSGRTEEAPSYFEKSRILAESYPGQ